MVGIDIGERNLSRFAAGETLWRISGRRQRGVGEKEDGVSKESKDLCWTLLETKEPVPEHSVFHDDFFEDTCEIIQNRNEAKVIQDIARLIVPSAQSLAVRGAKHLKCLIESVNEG